MGQLWLTKDKISSNTLLEFHFSIQHCHFVLLPRALWIPSRTQQEHPVDSVQLSFFSTAALSSFVLAKSSQKIVGFSTEVCFVFTEKQVWPARFQGPQSSVHSHCEIVQTPYRFSSLIDRVIDDCSFFNYTLSNLIHNRHLLLVFFSTTRFFQLGKQNWQFS